MDFCYLRGRLKVGAQRVAVGCWAGLFADFVKPSGDVLFAPGFSSAESLRRRPVALPKAA